MLRKGGRSFLRIVLPVFVVVATTTYILSARLEATQSLGDQEPYIEEHLAQPIDVARYGKGVGPDPDPRNQLEMFGSVAVNNGTYYRPPKSEPLQSLDSLIPKPCPGGQPLVPAYNGMSCRCIGRPASECAGIGCSASMFCRRTWVPLEAAIPDYRRLRLSPKTSGL